MAKIDFITIPNGPVNLNLAVAGRGPLILCVHGFPELWYSWRHQIDYFSERGFRVAALDVRGYGRSSKPEEIAAYTLRHLASDVVAVIEHMGDGPSILFATTGVRPSCGIRRCFIPTRSGRWPVSAC